MVLGWGKKVENRQENEEEMSMEEILASIRKYVSEDQQTQNQRDHQRDRQGLHQPMAAAPMARSMPDEEVSPYRLDREQMHHEQPPRSQGNMAAPPFNGGSMPQSYAAEPSPYVSYEQQEYRKEIPPSVLERPVTASMAARFPSELPKIEEVPEAGLFAQETLSATSQAFSKLMEISRSSVEKGNTSSAMRGTPVVTLEQLITDLARPTIKEWVDHHLPKMVESMIAQEIEKITRNLG